MNLNLSVKNFFHYGLCIMNGLLVGYIVYIVLNGEMFSSLNLSELYKWGAIVLNGVLGFVLTYRKAKKI